MQKLFLKNIFKRSLLLIPGIFWPFMYASSQDYFQQEVNYKIQVTLV